MKRKLTFLLVVIVLASSIIGCVSETRPDETTGTTVETTPTVIPEVTPAATPGVVNIQTPPHTAQNCTYYEIFVGSFYDSDGDGIGDLNGVTEKLDYLNTTDGKDTLGVQGIWLMPIHPSPTYHKYDVTDYYSIDPDYGTMEDFELLIEEAEKRNINVIIDLVLNHTSTQHPWFQAALEEIESEAAPYYQNFYNFSEERLGGYYPTAGGLYYEAHFWDQMPDLNMDSPELRAEIADIAEYWLKKGVAGFRLDAVMHVYSSEERNIEFWTWFTKMCRDIREDVFLVGEVWSSENAIMPYYTTGLALFAFPFHSHDGIINKALQSGNGDSLASELSRYDSEIRARNPDGVNCLFLSNHDTGRSAGFIREPEQRKLAAAIYLMAPGNPFIYYGEEIGMTGSGDDENKRTAMYWSSVDSTGITRNPIGATNDRVPEFGVAEQLTDPDSLLSYYREILALKAKYPDIYDSTAEKVDTDNKSICAIRLGSVIVIHNLSGEAVTIQIPQISGNSATPGSFLSPTGIEAVENGETLTLSPYATAVMS